MDTDSKVGVAPHFQAAMILLGGLFHNQIGNLRQTVIDFS